MKIVKNKSFSRMLYENCKLALKQEAKEAKRLFPTDKPAIRTIINDYAHYLCGEYDLTENQRNLLSKYACTLHPK